MTVRANPVALAGALLAVALIAGPPQRAEADPGTVTLSGYLTGSAGLTQFTNQQFTAVASFHWYDFVQSNAMDTVYPSSLTFTIGGNSYTSVPDDAIDTIIWNAGQSPIGNYGIELDATSLTDATGNIVGFFESGAYQPATQTVLLSDPLVQGGVLSMLLTDGDTLTIDSIDSFDPTASIFVPEPAALGLLGFGLVATVGLRRRRG